MDNLLPALTNIDVTSNRFRETALPYQQWEVKRTHNTPSTPSDIGHLLPPLRVRKIRPDSSGNPLPVPPDVEPSLPQPAPVDRNISDLYDPALDPSPIGREERGAVQPVRISRVLPHRELFPGGKDVRGVAQMEDPVATLVTVLNGYRSQTPACSNSLSGNGRGSAPVSDEEGCIDVFVEGFTKGIDHATLLPSEIYCRALQTGSQGPPNTSSSIPRESPRSLDARGGNLGLTVYLARAGEWHNAAGGDVAGHRIEHRHQCNKAASQNHNELAAESKITRMMFQREGKPGPSRNAFRVQFEPGPLGIELEEYPGQRGIVQVRHILQAGQAELDGRLSPGCFVVAVGDWEDWDEPDTTTTPPSNIVGAAKNAATAADDFDRRKNSGRISNAAGVSSARIHKPTMIRSLAEFEEAVSHRQPNRLFFIWALDRSAPEAVATLGELSFEFNQEMTAPHEWPVRASPGNSWRGREEKLSPDSEAIDPLDPFGAPILRRSHTLEGAPGWESGSAFARGKDSLEYSLSADEPESGASRAREEGGLQTGESRFESSLTTSAVGFLESNAEGALGTASGGGHRGDWAKRIDVAGIGPGFENGEAGDTGKWEFETGGGIFDEEDQGVAPRTQPSSNGARAQTAGLSSNEAGKNSPSFPLGLQASAVDELAVFIWFCNNHESAKMHVSWIDYDGKRVPRRSLEPGACYFERSFATHPWFVQYEDGNQSCHETVDQANQQRGKDASRSRGAPQPKHRQQGLQQGGNGGGEYCIVRLGDAVALARLTSSLIWNPTGRTLSITKQAKVGVPGMTAAACAEVGSGVTDGAGLDPGMKRLCMAAHQREAEEARARAGRAVIREEKARILQEMKTWRTHPIGGSGTGVGGERETAEVAVGGLGQGVPNLRVVMIGSSGWNE